MTQLTKEQAEEYFANGGSKCPHCKSETIAHYGDADCDGMEANQRVQCLDCSEIWEDVYTFSAISCDGGKWEKKFVARRTISIEYLESEDNMLTFLAIWLRVKHGSVLLTRTEMSIDELTREDFAAFCDAWSSLAITWDADLMNNINIDDIFPKEDDNA